MSSDRAPGTIDAHRIWKQFRPDRRRRSAAAAFKALRNREDWTWALRDVSLAAAPGDAVGIVGDNGSGKSTLLQIVGGVMYPTAGRIAAHGRIGALLEIRSGIHPELTGRENIFLYGSLLGLGRSDVARRYDEIVAFAGVEDALDRQVKFYSSGMKTRLGFAVAAFLEPDVLLVDEVLAVGDMAFQQRCLERMGEVIAGGTTLVYVSHDLASVEATCQRALWLDRGIVRSEGTSADVVAAYRRAASDRASDLGPLRVSDVRPASATTGAPLEISARLDTDVEDRVVVHVGLTLGTSSPVIVASDEIDLDAPSLQLTCRFEDLPLGRGTYAIWMAFQRTSGAALLPWRSVGALDVVGPEATKPPRAVSRLAPVHVTTTLAATPIGEREGISR
jgi:ABC-type polysaccharide/polyol phosphate transport system ATPase subunit